MKIRLKICFQCMAAGLAKCLRFQSAARTVVAAATNGGAVCCGVKQLGAEWFGGAAVGSLECCRWQQQWEQQLERERTKQPKSVAANWVGKATNHIKNIFEYLPSLSFQLEASACSSVSGMSAWAWTCVSVCVCVCVRVHPREYLCLRHCAMVWVCLGSCCLVSMSLPVFD